MQQQLHVITIMRAVQKERKGNKKKEERIERRKKIRSLCYFVWFLYYKMDWNGNKYFIFHHRRHCYLDFSWLEMNGARENT